MTPTQSGKPRSEHADRVLIGLGSALWLLVAGLLITPIRLQLTGERAAGVVTEVTSRSVNPPDKPLRTAFFATIHFAAGPRDVTVTRSWVSKAGRPLIASVCVEGCYARGDSVQVRYLTSNAATAMLGPFWHQVANLALLLLAAAAVLPGALLLRRGRAVKANAELALRGRISKGAHHKRGATAVLIALSVAGVAPPVGAQPATRISPERAAALAVADSALVAITRGDATALTDLMVPEAVLFPTRTQGGITTYRLRTRAEQRAASINGVVERGFRPEVRVNGAVAMVWYPYDLYINGAWSHCGVDVFTLIRADGRWRIATMVWSAEQSPTCEKHPDGPPKPGQP